MKLELVKIFIPRGVAAAGTILLTLIIPFVSDVNSAANIFTGIALLYLLGIFSRFGFDLLIMKSTSHQFESTRKTISLNELLTLILPLVFSSFLLALSQSIELNYFQGDLNWVFYALPAFSGYGMLSPFLRGSGMEVWAALTEIGSVSLLTSMFIAVQALYETQYVTPSTSFVFAAWVLYVFNFLLILKCFKFKQDGEGVFPNIKQSYHFFLNQASSYLTQWYPVFLFAQMDARLVIYYSVANRMATIISFIGVTIDAYAAPRFSTLWKEKRFSDLIDFKNTINGYSKRFSSVGFLTVLMVSIGYGVYLQYESTYFLYSGLLLMSYAASIALGPNGFFLMMTRDNKYVTYMTLLSMLAVLIMSTIAYLLRQDFMIVILVSLVIFLRNGLFYWKVKRARLG
jgi:O-antigen/teichoic acid export membrane protein